MTTPITKEQLIARIETQKETALKHPECSVALMDLEIANIARAAMDAEPVAYADPQALINFKSDEGKITARTREWMWRRPGEDLIPLYAAPPAPVVPEIDRKAIADRVYGKCCRIPGATFYNAAEFALDEVDACRAEILKNCASVKPSTDAGCVTNKPSNCASVKDHQIRELVNELRDIAVEYHGTQQLREHIARTVRSAILRLRGEGAPLLDSEGENTESTPGGNEPVSQVYKLPENSFTNDDLEMMAHSDNPQANAYRELLAFRRGTRQ